MSSDRVPVLRGRCRGPAGPDTRIGANELGGTLDEASLLARLDLARVSAQEGQISEAIAEFQDVLALGQPGAAAYDRFARETSEQIGGAGARFLLALGQVGQAVALAELERSTNRCGSCAMPSRSARMTRNQSSNSSWRLRASLRRAWSRQAASREGQSGRDGRLAAHRRLPLRRGTRCRSAAVAFDHARPEGEAGPPGSGSAETTPDS
jgi:hypothetical protein